ncbi:MAG TPA: hypothetical protein VEA99_15485 [Gemmatimonadaceae bacterium]|nr:hypothetical protein [Gemmatimonadaceae bacterium]
MIAVQPARRAAATALTTAVLASTTAVAQAAAGSRPHCIGGMAGRVEHPAADVVYFLAPDTAGPRIAAAVVVRAPESWLRRDRGMEQPPRIVGDDGRPRYFETWRSGSLFIRFDDEASHAWLDSTSVAMSDSNVVLVEVGGSARPRVVGRARVDDRVTGHSLDERGCIRLPLDRARKEALDRAVGALVLRGGGVRAHLGRPLAALPTPALDTATIVETLWRAADVDHRRRRVTVVAVGERPGRRSNLVSARVGEVLRRRGISLRDGVTDPGPDTVVYRIAAMEPEVGAVFVRLTSAWERWVGDCAYASGNAEQWRVVCETGVCRADRVGPVVHGDSLCRKLR